MPLALDVLLPLPLVPLRWLAPHPPEGDQRADPDAALVGRRVVVPWRGGPRVGVITATERVPDPRALELKDAIDLLDDRPWLPPATVAWIVREADRTVCPAGVVLHALHLPGLRPELEHRVAVLDPAQAPEGTEPGAWCDVGTLGPERWAALREEGLLLESVTERRPETTCLVPAATAADPRLEGARRAPQRRALATLAALGEATSGTALAEAAGVPVGTVRTLVKNGFARYASRPKPDPDPPEPPAPRPWPEDANDGADDRATDGATDGTADPPAAVHGGNRARRLRAFLPALRRDLAAGRVPIVLAPERVWADEAAAWLANDVPVAPLAADLDAPQRAAWDRRVRDGPPAVLVGTWPVLAAPVPRAGRLLSLEAESESQKLRAGPRSWIPAAARLWADAHDVPWSATDVLAGPELRKFAAPRGRIVALPRPRVRWALADLRRARSWPLSDDAIRVLKQVHERGRQALLLVPRRGFSAALGCRDCGAATMCPNCDLALRWHARDRRLRCHQCGHQQAPPDSCPACGGHDLGAQRAAGSEWVLRALERAVPDLPRVRYDADARESLQELSAGAPGVLVGTSAVLRLPPLPVLSLIVVTQVDGALHADDFRADERVLRTLASLHESAGARAPLGLIQTFAPDHPVLRAVASGEPESVDAVVRAMDARRRAFGYPPHGRLARVQIAARREGDAWDAATEIIGRLRTAGANEADLLGPAPAPVARIRGRSLVQVLIRSDDDAHLRALLASGVTDGLRSVQVRTDVDPRDIGEVLD